MTIAVLVLLVLTSHPTISPLIKTAINFTILSGIFELMRKTNIRYWLCQITGWGVWGLIILYFNFVVFGDRLKEQGGEKENLISLAIFLAVGILITHILRLILKRMNWMKFSFNKIALMFIIAVGATGTVLFYGGNFIEYRSGYSYDKYVINKRWDKARKMEDQYGLSTLAYYKDPALVKDSSIKKGISEIRKTTGWYRNKKGEWVHEAKTDLVGIYYNLLLIAIWMLIYIVYHYVEKNRRDQLDRLKLESTVKELELKTIKSHINPHFIFNSLNSIRALVDENPTRARRAITELSNILRSSMQAEKSETVPLEKELDIVKDYLALEQMRFEERLKIEMDIDQDTLGEPVPPMMLQTLVENSIKHGISKLVNGGVVRIVADFKDNHLELSVQNTGQLNGNMNGDGFGIKSTQDRLNLMYQGKAVFQIKNLNDTMVESKVSFPVIV
ncbi:MAG TPA: histidine kinase [Ferruginibacter sp.]|nr:histidine kinase [Ferruginibacter sp.]